MTTNLAISAQRRSLRERRALARVSARRQLDAPPPEVDGFWALVRELPPQQAAAVALYYLHDLPIADLADALGCGEGTAKAHLYKARATLAARLDERRTRRSQGMNDDFDALDDTARRAAQGLQAHVVQQIDPEAGLGQLGRGPARGGRSVASSSPARRSC